MKNKKHPIITWLSVLLLIGSGMASAADLERSQLAELINEIDFLRQRVEEIRVDAPARNRLRFQYKDLMHDLALMRRGISDYIDADIREGRDIAPLKGSYR